MIKSTIKTLLSQDMIEWIRLKKVRLKRRPPVGLVRFGSLRRLKPIGRVFGVEYGQCIDRYYIEAFLDQYRADIQGCVLEIGDNIYTCKFGGEQVTQSDILHATSDNPKTTIIADLTCAHSIDSESFDCIILTQTLQFIYDVPATIRTLYRVLKPGGVLLATFPGISQISRYDMEHWGEYWRFTTLSARKLFIEAFCEHHVTIQSYGNVLTAIAFMHGLISQELRNDELDYHDNDYEVIIAVRAVKL